MNARAQIAILPDGRRHFHDGPIDLILEASGAKAVTAYEAAAARFATILDELCLELPRLRAASGPPPEGVVARRMVAAVAPFAEERFITPMAAVAGAVAEEVLAAMVDAAPLERAYVNNGGDIAFHLAWRPAVPSPVAGEGQGEGSLRPEGILSLPPLTPTLSRKGRGGREGGAHSEADRDVATFEIGMVALSDRPSLFGKARISSRDSARGIATSGWRGRSFSLGIADAVTVIARTASLADAAATLIANAVDLPGHPAIMRAPARSRDPQSDLGDRLVTLAVSALAADDIEAALDRGAREAQLWLERGLIAGAALSLQGECRLAGAHASLYAGERSRWEPRHAVG